ncbi:hypothetical protein BU15DRAFT_75192 [Melanogaster broomeanus]|nr:hypothetical protein BU15DRAFT_75192 [Melanogaster broomeanus]
MRSVKVIAFFYAIWSFILRLVHSFNGLFPRSQDASALSRTRQRKESLALHTNLSHIILFTQRLVAFISFSLRGSAIWLSRVFAAENHNPTTSVFQGVIPRRTSPRNGMNDAELGLSDTITSMAADLRDQPQASAAQPQAVTPDTQASIQDCSMPLHSIMPLTPPEPCHFRPLKSANDYFYSHPWPINLTMDRNKSCKLPSPLSLSLSTDVAFPESIVRAWDSPGRRATVQIWTSTPTSGEKNLPFGTSRFGGVHSSLADSLPIRTARRSWIMSFYDDVSIGTTLSDSSISSDDTDLDGYLEHTRPLRTQAPTSVPDVYLWRHHDACPPGEPHRTRSPSPTEWHDDSADVSFPIAKLSPPDACPPLSESQPVSPEPESGLCTSGAPTSSAIQSGTSKEFLPTPTSTACGTGTLGAEDPRKRHSDPSVPTEQYGSEDRCSGRDDHDFQERKRC